MIVDECREFSGGDLDIAATMPSKNFSRSGKLFSNLTFDGFLPGNKC
jgi:hypothetical protein